MNRSIYRMVFAVALVGAAGRAAGDYMVYTNSSGFGPGGDISRAGLDGTDQRTLIDGLDGPGGIAVDLAAGQMYWTNGDANTYAGNIQRAKLDGSGQQVLVRNQLLPISIALDPTAGQMYWITHVSNSSLPGKDIRRANLDGSGVVKTLVHTTGVVGNGTVALDLAGGRIYTTDFNENRIRTFNLDGSSGTTLIPGLKMPVGIAIDAAHGKMYWTDAGTPSLNFADGDIRRANLDGSNPQTLVQGLAAPNGIALDLDAGKIYWADFIGGDIGRANLDGSGQETLLSGLDNPEAIALVPLLGDANRDGKVDFADLLVLAQHYGTPNGSTRSVGDFNGDGKVGFDDLLILAQHYGTSDAAPGLAPAPEPTTPMMTLGGTMLLARRRRR